MQTPPQGGGGAQPGGEGALGVPHHARPLGLPRHRPPGADTRGHAAPTHTCV